MRGSGGFRDDALDEIEVVEDDGLPPGSAHPGEGSDSHAVGAGRTADRVGGERSRHRAARRAVLGAAAVVLVGVLAATGAELAAERDRQMRLAAVPGVVGGGVDLTEPLEEQWRVAGSTAWAAPIGGGVVLADVGEDGGSLRGVGREGEPLWDVALAAGASCIPLAAPEVYAGIPGFLSLASALEEPVPTVVCEEPGTGLGAWSTVDGSVTGTLPYDGEVRTIANLGTDLVAVTADSAGGDVVRRWSPGTGEVVWEAPAPAARRGLPWLSWDIAVVDGTVLVRGTGTVRLDADTGVQAEGRQASGDEAARERGYLDRSLVLLRVLEDGTEVVLQLRRGDLPGTVLRQPDGRTQTLDGQVVLPVMSDERDADALLVATADAGGSALLAHDVATGVEVWRADGVEVRSVLLDLEGRLVVLAGSDVVALDRTTGERLWSAPRSPDLALAPVSDGEVVLLTETGTRAGNDLVARRLRDGTELWRAPLPSGAVEVGAVADVVLVRTAEGLVGLG